MMSETKLQEAELTALVDLIRVVAGIDGDISPEESDEVALIARQVGVEPFWRQFSNSAFRAARKIGIKECAEAVRRRPAQALIYSLLEGLAQADGVDQSERDVLDELRHIWSIKD